MKTKKYLLLLSSFAFLLSGCGNNSTGDKPIDDPDIPEPETHEHVLSVTDSGETHTYTCADCDLNASEAHIFGTFIKDECLKETTDTDKTYFYSCPICGHKSSETFVVPNESKYWLKGEPVVSTPDQILSETISTLGLSAMEAIGASLLVGAYIQQYLTKGEEKTVTIKKYTYEYISKYIDGTPIVLSAGITVPFVDGEPVIYGIEVDNHPTFTDANEAPSQCFDIYAVLAFIGFAVIETDLLGFGSTVNMPADYHCRHLANRNTVDSVLAALDIIKFNIGVDPKDKYMINTGYSQGGYDALALMRYLEEEATPEEKAAIKFNKNFCGSGAYDLKVMIEDSLTNKNFEFSEYILMGLMTAFYYHNEDFGGFLIDDFLKNAGKPYVNAILSKSDAAIQELKKTKTKPSDFFNNSMLDPESRLYEVLETYCDHENLINGSWLPTGELYLFYSVDDELVSHNCSLKALEVFNGLENVGYRQTTGTHKGCALDYFTYMIETIEEDLNAIAGIEE